MSNFDSLTLALEDWFATPLRKLPDALRRRVEKEFAPMPWDELSAEARRSVTLQLDYQHDPTTEQDQQFWWDFFERKGALKEQIAQWEAVATQTVGDLAQRESRLAELQLQLAHLENRESRDRKASLGSQYYPSPKRPEPVDVIPPGSATSPSKYVAYPKAIQLLAGRIDATPEELAAWVFFGPEDSGLAAYLNANELDPPPRFQFGLGDGTGKDTDYVSPLMACWFRADDLAGFEPKERYVTGSTLIQRWSNRPELIPEAYIRAKIRESRLQDAHPIYGITQGSRPNDPSWPPLADGLHRLSDVEAIEAEDFPVDWVQGDCAVDNLEPSPEQGTEVGESATVIATPPVVAQPTAISDSRTTMLAEAETPAGKVASADPCADFRAMQKLSATELTITFVGDRLDAGLGANSLLEISARKTTRRLALASLGLADRRHGGPNSQAAILLGMATGRRLAYSQPNATKMKRLRDVLRMHLGVAGDPFQPYRKNDGWVPLFAVHDNRGAAEERAKLDAERHTESLEARAERGAPLPQAQDSHRPFDAEGDETDAWLRAQDRSEPT